VTGSQFGCGVLKMSTGAVKFRRGEIGKCAPYSPEFGLRPNRHNRVSIDNAISSAAKSECGIYLIGKFVRAILSANYPLQPSKDRGVIAELEYVFDFSNQRVRVVPKRHSVIAVRIHILKNVAPRPV
jgi:hypothetical protein